MTSKTASFVAGILLFASGTLHADFLGSISASNDSSAEFARRIPAKSVPSATALRDAEAAAWNLYRYEALSDAASFIFASGSSPSDRAGITGSIVIPGDEWRVRFYAVDASGKPAAAGDVVFARNGTTSVVPKDQAQPLSEGETLLARAQELVLSTTAAPCDDLYKVVTLPTQPGAASVYRIRVALDGRHVPEGQHVRYDVSATSDGVSISNQYDFSRRCNILTKQTAPGSKVEEIKVTYSQEPQPNEIYIYLSLRYAVSFYMLTSKSNIYWQIENGTVSID